MEFQVGDIVTFDQHIGWILALEPVKVIAVDHERYIHFQAQAGRTSEDIRIIRSLYNLGRLHWTLKRE